MKWQLKNQQLSDRSYNYTCRSINTPKISIHCTYFFTKFCTWKRHWMNYLLDYLTLQKCYLFAGYWNVYRRVLLSCCVWSTQGFWESTAAGTKLLFLFKGITKRWTPVELCQDSQTFTTVYMDRPFFPLEVLRYITQVPWNPHASCVISRLSA